MALLKGPKGSRLPEIDWNSHQALGLTHCYRHDVGEAVNLVTGQVDATWRGFDQEDVSRFGVGRRANVTAVNNDGLKLDASEPCPLTMSGVFTVSDIGSTIDEFFFWKDSDGGRRFYHRSGNFNLLWGGGFVSGPGGAGFGPPTDDSPFTIIYSADDGTRTGRYGYYFLNHRTGEYLSATGTHSRNENANTWTSFHNDGTLRVPGIHHEYRIYTDHFIDEAQALAILEDRDRLYSPGRLYFVPAGSGGPTPVTGSGTLVPGAASVSGAGAHSVAGSGDLTPGAASVSGTGAHGVSGTGTLTPGPASVTGSGSHSGPAPGPVTGSGILTPGAAEIDGAGYALVSGAGTLTPAPAQASGIGAHGVAGSGALAPGAATVTGTGFASAPAGSIVGSGTLVPGAAQVQAWGLTSPPPDLSGIGEELILEVGLPYSVNSIINGALDLIASNTIQSLSDSSSHVGNSIKRGFDVERDALLREYPWNFAMRRASLAASATAPAFRFGYAYELPAGPDPEYCLRVWAVGNEESRLDTDVWEISGRRLLTDLGPPLPIRYIGRIINPALWDAMTIKAFEARLAWQAAYLASGSAALAEQMARIYNERLDAAKSVDAQEGTPEPFDDGTTWIDSRHFGGVAY